jgi:membrane associated rhomboid family serine protease
MGIYDRDYYRKDGGRFYNAWAGNAPACRWLIILTLSLLLIQVLTRGVEPHGRHLEPTLGWFTKTFAFQGEAIFEGQVWRLITGAFLPVVWGLPLLGLFFNLLFLWWFGRDVEEMYGTAEFVAYYIGAALIGSLATLALVFAGTTGLEPKDYVVCGTGAITSVLVLFALHYPRRTILLFFLLPVPIWIIIAFQVLKDLSDLAGGGKSAFAAHLGGAAFALFYFQTGVRLTNWLPRRREKAAAPRRPQLRVFRDEETAPAEPVTAPVAATPVVDEALEAKVDALLEKVAQHGQESLTEAEREILFRASEAYKKKRKSQ